MGPERAQMCVACAYPPCARPPQSIALVDDMYDTYRDYGGKVDVKDSVQVSTPTLAQTLGCLQGVGTLPRIRAAGSGRFRGAETGQKRRAARSRAPKP